MTTRQTLDEARSLYASNRLDESEAAFNRVLDARTSRAMKAEAHYGLGLVKLSRGDSRGAGESLRLSLESEPGNADALFYLGQIAEREGSSDEAVSYYGRALTINPRSPALAAMTRLSAGDERAQQPTRSEPVPQQTTAQPTAHGIFATQRGPQPGRLGAAPLQPGQPMTVIQMPAPGDEDFYTARLTEQMRAERKASWNSLPIAIRVFMVAFFLFVFGFIAFGFFQAFTHWG